MWNSFGEPKLWFYDFIFHFLKFFVGSSIIGNAPLMLHFHHGWFAKSLKILSSSSSENLNKNVRILKPVLGFPKSLYFHESVVIALLWQTMWWSRAPSKDQIVVNYSASRSHDCTSKETTVCHQKFVFAQQQQQVHEGQH